MSADDATWQAVAASATGSSHARTGMPNQDASKVQVSQGGVVAAVADGHGGSRYVRSDVGAQLAVRVAVEGGGRLLTELGDDPGTEAIESELKTRLAPEVVEQWRQLVLAHLEGAPFTQEERDRADDPLDGDPLISYGCTLLVAVLGPTYVGLTQLGDGDSLVVSHEGATTSPVPGDSRLVANETTSLCLPQAAKDTRVAVLRSPLPELVILASDGYGNSFAEPRWREESGSGMLEAVRTGGLADTGAKLPDWLAESARVGGDDVTMVLAARTVDEPEPIVAGADAATRPPRRVGRSLGLAVGLLVALLIGGAVGWAAHRPAKATATHATATHTTAAKSPTGLPKGSFVVNPSLLVQTPLVFGSPNSVDPAPSIPQAVQAQLSVDLPAGTGSPEITYQISAGTLTAAKDGVSQQFTLPSIPVDPGASDPAGRSDPPEVVELVQQDRKVWVIARDQRQRYWVLRVDPLAHGAKWFFAKSQA